MRCISQIIDPNHSAGSRQSAICLSMLLFLPWSAYVTMRITFLMLRLLIHYRGRPTDRAAVSMGEMLCHLLEELESTDDLVDILGCGHEETSLPMVGAALFDRGWLSPRYPRINPIGTLALGDIGYVIEDNGFVTVDNFHQSLQAGSGTLSWKESIGVQSGNKYFGDAAAEDVEIKPGTSYQKRRYVRFFVFLRLLNILF